MRLRIGSKGLFIKVILALLVVSNHARAERICDRHSGREACESDFLCKWIPPSCADLVALKPGDQGSSVGKLQDLLKQKGYDVNIDNIFGNQTRDALKKFQNDAGVPATGVFDRKTRDQFSR